MGDDNKIDFFDPGCLGIVALFVIAAFALFMMLAGAGMGQ